MNRYCFVMRIRPRLVGEYRQRHSEVWPEMRQALRDAGWTNYSLFLQADGLLIGYLEAEDFASAQRAMAASKVNQRWQSEMQRYFEGIESPPDEAFVPLTEIFHLD